MSARPDAVYAGPVGSPACGAERRRCGVSSGQTGVRGDRSSRYSEQLFRAGHVADNLKIKGEKGFGTRVKSPIHFFNPLFLHALVNAAPRQGRCTRTSEGREHA